MTLPATTRRPRWRAILGGLVLVVALVFAAIALRHQWPGVREAVGTMAWPALLGAGAFAALGIVCSAEQQWQLIRSWTSSSFRLQLFRLYFVSQLGKYLPGPLWAYAAQMELARSRGIDRRTSVFSILLGAAISVLAAGALTGLVISTPAFSAVPEGLRWSLIGIAIAVVGVMVARPGAVDRLARWGMKKTKGEEPQTAPSPQRIRAAIVWTFASWLAFGVHLWILLEASGAGGVGAVPLAIGGFAAAWVVGFLVFFVPAGIGVREGVMVGVLVATGLEAGTALAIALVSRFLIVAAEVALALPSIIERRRQRA